MKKWIAVLTAVLVCLTLACCAGNGSSGTTDEDGNISNPSQSSLDTILSKGVLVVGTSPDYAPYEFINPNLSGQASIVGADMAFIRYVAEKMGVTIEIMEIEFDSIEIAVQTGSIDIGVAGYSYTDERAENFDLSDPYSSNPNGQRVLVRKGEEADYASADDFAGKRIAVQNASFQQKLAEEQLPDSAILVPITNLNDAVLMLLSKQVDGIAVDGGNGLAILNSHSEELGFAVFEFDFEDEVFVLMLRKDSPELLAEVNRIIKEVIDKNLFEQWYQEAVELQEELGVE